MSWDAIDDAVQRRIDAVSEALEARPAPRWDDPYIFALWRGAHPASLTDDDEAPVRPGVFWLTTPDNVMPLMAEQVWALERANPAVLLMGNTLCTLSTTHKHEALDPVQELLVSLLVLPWGVTTASRNHAFLTAHVTAADVSPVDAQVYAARRRPPGWPP